MVIKSLCTRFRRYLYALLCCIPGVLCGCQPEYQHEIRFGLSAAPVTLDPRYATDAESARICRLLYQRLVDFGPDFQPVAALANWQQFSPQHYRFYLRDENRLFHHGNRLDSSDVKATYLSVLQDEPVSPHRASLSNIQTIEIIDEDTIDFILQQDDLLFPGKLVIGILPAELIQQQHPFHLQPIGSGGLAFAAWENEGVVELVRTQDQQPIRFVVTRDPTVRALKLLRGELDLVQSNLPPELIRWLRQQPDIHAERQSGNHLFSYLGFNMQDPVSGDIYIRKAIAHAIDRKAMIEHVLDNTATLAESILPPGHWAQATLTAYSYSPEQARHYLHRYRQKHGIAATEPIHLVYKTSTNPLRLRLATLMQHQLRQVGFDIEIHSSDWGAFYADIRQGRFQMYSLSWVGLKMPDIFRYIFHSESVPPQGANRGRLNVAQVDALIERAEAGAELAEQATHYRALQKVLHELLVFVPLWYENQIIIHRSLIADYTAQADGSYDGLLHTRKNVSD